MRYTRVRNSETQFRLEIMPSKINSEVLAAAIEGFEAQKKRIDVQIEEIRELMRGGASGSAAMPASDAAPQSKRKRKRMSAEGRKRIAEAQRKRWAETRGATAPAAKPAAKKAKRKLSAEGRARIIEATKKRWAAVRAAAAKAAK